MNTKSFTPLLAALLFQLQLHAQSAGKILDNKTRHSVSSATITLYSKNTPAPVATLIPDSSGNFRYNVAPGRYRIEITAIGYLALTKELALSMQPGIDTFLLEPEVRQLEGVTVTSERPVFHRKGDRLILPVAGNQFFKTAANGLDILKKIPGISVAGDGSILMDGRITPAVFINGKPIPMSAEELQNYISSLNPEMIASIELISNPSARYDGEIKGILDIRLKKDINLGWKGNITTTTSRNEYTLSETNLSLTYKTPQLLYTLRGGYTNGTRIYKYRAKQILSDKNILSTRTKTPTFNSNLNYQLGAEYSFSKQHRAELTLRHYLVDRDVNSVNTLFATDPAGEQTTLNTRTVNHFAPEQNNYGGGLNYSGIIGKTDLQFLATFLKISNRQNEDIQNRNNDGNELLSYWKTALNNDITIRTAQSDLSREAFSGRMAIGIKSAFTTTRNDLRYDTLNDQQQFVPDSGRSNRFTYDEYINAAYLSWEKNKNNFTWSVSLRAEHTHSIANSVTTQQITKRNYLNWLPSVSLTYSSNNRQYRLSFTRRITRPTFTQLNPFRFYLSPLNYHVGNPMLLPSKTSSVNLAYSHKTFSIRLSGGKETDPLSRYPEYNDTTHTLEYLGRNLPYNHFFTTEVSYAFALTKWWRHNHSLTISYKKEQTPYHNKTYIIGIWDYTIIGSQVFSLPKGFNADVSYKYLSPGGNGLYTYRSYFYIDLGLQKAWLNGRLNTRLNYYDIFNKFEVQYIFREKQIINNELAHWFGTNRVAATITYSFGKSGYKSKQSNRVEEEGRTGLQ